MIVFGGINSTTYFKLNSYEYWMPDKEPDEGFIVGDNSGLPGDFRLPSWHDGEFYYLPGGVDMVII